MSSNRRASLPVNSLRRSPRRSRTKTPSVNELSNKLKISPRGKRRLEFQQEKPLKGQTFYFDVQGYRGKNTLQARIKQLGGIVEEFLSKDISFVVTNKRDVDLRCSPRSHSTPSPGMSIPSPYPGNTNSSSAKGSAAPSPHSADSSCSAEQLGHTGPRHATRGKALAKQAAVTCRYGTSNVIANARNWGLEIVHLDKLLEKLERYGGLEKTSSTKSLVSERVIKKSVKAKVRPLNAPFIKVEDHSRCYKPLVHELKEWPKIYFDGSLGSCPFDSPKKQLRNELEGQVKDQRKHTQEEKNKKKGFCECCCTHYEDLDLHLRSEQHQSFARNPSNYRNLDELISRGPSLQVFLAKITVKHQKMEADKRNRKKMTNSGTSRMQREEKTPTKQGQQELHVGIYTPVNNPKESSNCELPCEKVQKEGVIHVDNASSRFTQSRSSAAELEIQAACLKREGQELRKSPRITNGLKEKPSSPTGTKPFQRSQDEADSQSTGDSGRTERLTRSRTRHSSVSPVDKHIISQPQDTADTRTEMRKKLSRARKSAKSVEEWNENVVKVECRSESADESSGKENHDPSFDVRKKKGMTHSEDHKGGASLPCEALCAAQDSVKVNCLDKNSVEFEKAISTSPQRCATKTKFNEPGKYEIPVGRVARSRLHKSLLSTQELSKEDNKVSDVNVTSGLVTGTRDEHVIRVTRSRVQSASVALIRCCGTTHVNDDGVCSISEKAVILEGNRRSRFPSVSTVIKKEVNSEETVNGSQESSPSPKSCRHRRTQAKEVDCTEGCGNKQLPVVVESTDHTTSLITAPASKENTKECDKLIVEEKTKHEMSVGKPSAAQVKVSDCRSSLTVQRPIVERESDDSTTVSIQLSSKENSSERTLSDKNNDVDLSSTPTLQGYPSSPGTGKSEQKTIPRYIFRKRAQPESRKLRPRKRARFENQSPNGKVKSIQKRSSRRRSTMTTAFTSIKSKKGHVQRQRSKSANNSKRKTPEKRPKRRRYAKVAFEKTPHEDELDSSSCSGSPQSGPIYQSDRMRGSSMNSVCGEKEANILERIANEQNAKRRPDEPGVIHRESPYSENCDSNGASMIAALSCSSGKLQKPIMNPQTCNSLTSVGLINSDQKKQTNSGADGVTDPLTLLFDSDSDGRDFYGFEVPHFDAGSFSSEVDLSFRINSIVENMSSTTGCQEVEKTEANEVHMKADRKEENSETVQEKGDTKGDDESCVKANKKRKQKEIASKTDKQRFSFMDGTSVAAKVLAECKVSSSEMFRSVVESFDRYGEGGDSDGADDEGDNDEVGDYEGDDDKGDNDEVGDDDKGDNDEVGDDECDDDKGADNAGADVEVVDDEVVGYEGADNEVTDDEVADDEVDDDKCAENEVADDAVDDDKCAENEVADVEVVEYEVVEYEVADNEVADNEVADNEGTDDEVADDEGDDDVFSSVADSSDGEEEQEAKLPFSFPSWRPKRKSEDIKPEKERPAKRRKSCDQGDCERYENHRLTITSPAANMKSGAQIPVNCKASEETPGAKRTSVKSRFDELIDLEKRGLVDDFGQEPVARTQICTPNDKPALLQSVVDFAASNTSDTGKKRFSSSKESDWKYLIEYDTGEPVFETIEERVKLRRIKSMCERERSELQPGGPSQTYRQDDKTHHLAHTKAPSSDQKEEKQPQLPPLKPLRKRLQPLKPLKQVNTVSTTGISLRSRAKSTPTAATFFMSPTHTRKASWIYNVNEFLSQPSAANHFGGNSLTCSTPCSRTSRVVGTFRRVNELRRKERQSTYPTQLAKEKDAYAFDE